MTPDERAALDRQRRIAQTPAITLPRRAPLEGQPMLFTPPCYVCGSAIIRHEGRWCCPKCANIDEDE